MIVTLEEAKNWLKVETDEDDQLITMLIKAAEGYILNATGIEFDSTNEVAQTLCLLLVADWYEDRDITRSPGERVRYLMQSMVAQLQYCYEVEGDP